MRLRILVAASLVAWALWLAGPGPAASPPPVPDAESSPRIAALLAFHAAQDAGDIVRMLLERLGEAELAAHVRQAVRTVAEDAARRQ
jgi:hypothetical protein